jgi:hypothetical protein
MLGFVSDKHLTFFLRLMGKIENLARNMAVLSMPFVPALRTQHNLPQPVLLSWKNFFLLWMSRPWDHVWVHLRKLHMASCFSVKRNRGGLQEFACWSMEVSRWPRLGHWRYRDGLGLDQRDTAFSEYGTFKDFVRP